MARAIARHMSVDLSPEGFAARNRTGIAILVFGGPLTGEDNTQIECCHLRVGLKICCLIENLSAALYIVRICAFLI